MILNLEIIIPKRNQIGIFGTECTVKKHSSKIQRIENNFEQFW